MAALTDKTENSWEILPDRKWCAYFIDTGTGDYPHGVDRPRRCNSEAFWVHESKYGGCYYLCDAHHGEEN